MFIVENVGQTEAFFKKGHFTSTGISSVKKISRKITHVGDRGEELEPLEAILDGFYKIKN